MTTPCPSCGYCPSCGRSRTTTYYPYSPNWQWYQDQQWRVSTTTAPTVIPTAAKLTFVQQDAVANPEISC